MKVKTRNTHHWQRFGMWSDVWFSLWVVCFRRSDEMKSATADIAAIHV